VNGVVVVDLIKYMFRFNINQRMSKRKATIDISSDRSSKIQKILYVVGRVEKKRKRVCDNSNENSYPSTRQCIRESPYLCSLHDNDCDVCSIYNCSGGGKQTLNENVYNYIN